MARCMHILSTARHVFGKSRKITSFRGESWGLPVGKKLTASENHFHSEKLGLCMYFRLQLQLNLQLKKRDSSLLRTTLQAGCHEIAYVAGRCFHFGFMHCNQARDRIKSSFTCSKDVFNSIRKIKVRTRKRNEIFRPYCATRIYILCS